MFITKFQKPSQRHPKQTTNDVNLSIEYLLGNHIFGIPHLHCI